jgi:hypothetical protein
MSNQHCNQMSYGTNINDSFHQMGIHTGPDTQRHQARRLACHPVDEVQAGHQPQDRESARPDDPIVYPSAS